MKDHRTYTLTMRRSSGWVLLLAASVALLAVDSFLVETNLVGSTDRWVWNFYASSLGPASFRIVEAFTLVGLVRDSSLALELSVGLLTLGIAALLVARRQPRLAILLATAVAGAASISQLLKTIVLRSGPGLNQWTPLGHTFPSGTAATAVALFGFLAWLVFRRLGEGRWVLGPGCMILMLAFVASSLTYHFPTEVLGGVATGAAWLSLVVLVYEGWTGQRDPVPQPPL